MKGGLYVAILLTALLCDDIVSDDITNDETGFLDVYSTGGEISDGGKEPSDSEVNDELHSIVIQNSRVHIALADSLINDKTEINKPVKTEFHNELFGEFATDENHYYDESLFSAEDLNYGYSDDRNSNEFIKDRISDDGELNIEEIKRPNRFSRELGVEEIFSSEEDTGWDTKDERTQHSKDENPTLAIEKEKDRVSKEKRGRVTKKENGVIEKGRAARKKGGDNKEKRNRVSKEDNGNIKKETGGVSEEEGGWIGNELHASDQAEETKQISNPLNPSTFILVKHYYCMTRDVTEKHLILYGSKAWEFPLQDVNLTLTYPTAKPKSPLSPDSVEEEEFIITGFKVILYVEGAQTRGYITDGGILQDKLSVTFITSNTTALFYQFWLYGTPKTNAQLVELHNLYYMCS